MNGLMHRNMISTRRETANSAVLPKSDQVF